MQANSVRSPLCLQWIHKRCSGVRGDLSLVADGFRCKRCDRTIQEADLAGDLVVDGETYGCVKNFLVIWETLLMEMVERILLLQLESEMDAISDIQSSPARDERSSVYQLYQKQHDLGK